MELFSGAAVHRSAAEILGRAMSSLRRFGAATASLFTASDAPGKRFEFEDVYPSVECGRFPAKRIAGEIVDVWADILRDGHDVLAAQLHWRLPKEKSWHTARMQLQDNDRWHGSFVPQRPGRYLFALHAWTDRFGTWRRDFVLKRDAGEDLTVERAIGRQMLADAIADHPQVESLRSAIAEFERHGDEAVLLAEDTAMAMAEFQVRSDEAWSASFPLVVDRPLARAGAWYELFPRSQGPLNGRHGTFQDCIDRVPDIAALGFDVIYLPPIHPIGTTNRKGKNNSLQAAPDDPGSPYAIGGVDGGHDAVHPQLGTLKDFRRLVKECEAHGLEIALDFAVQCSPDHPWITQHPEWFQWQPNGRIRYAENPPKKYQDIVNPDLYCDKRAELWTALRDVVLFWRDQGVRIFRVDNPHTKPLPFWEWLIADVKDRDPDVIFLSEAFTRPKIMKALAKIGFSQSYTYFTWRTTRPELEEYLSELTRYPEREYFRPNFFVNTPDILPVHLQAGEPWMFKSRVALAATLSASYGMYSGFELLEHTPIPGREEYLDSEKYEIKPRDWDKPGNIKDYVARLNRIRRSNPALLQTNNLRFLQVDDGHVLGFVKEATNYDNAVASAIALAPGRREFWLHFGDLRIGPGVEQRPVLTLENLHSGEQHRLEWGGVRLTIDADSDPALLFRCLV
jgi:starch synthase (maltosyl-transferring)